jgi:deoxyribonuclease V
MFIHSFHRWDVSCKEAIAIQETLKTKICLTECSETIRWIAGCDIAIHPETEMAVGGVIVYSFPEMRELERRFIIDKIRFPYVPGLLAFREAPLLLKVLESLTHEPDLVIFDGQGIAHPRGMGIASHLGLFLDKPTIGCGKSRLCGEFREPGKRAGSVSDLFHHGQVVASVLRTRTNVKPVFVSPGHKISMSAAVKIILQCCDGYRIPKPTREADRYVEAVKNEKLKMRGMRIVHTVYRIA